uniref:uncharacterized protein LOC120808277 isoform X2 n=1 Tax=Gasterosteus aculeatus aculeatus TaxID=481459 RepID=UPI001A99AE13|nr:uncharacterized protein LOC120808277 isoform X2 [Gasterosteus aculeatus aculeatus]
MAELRWIMTSSLVMLQVLSCTVTSVETSSVTVRDEDEVMFPCESEIHDQKKCDSTAWLFSSSNSTVTLFEFGKIKEGANNRLDRLNVTEECSLVIKKVKGQDAGQYTCRQFISGKGSQVGDIVYQLSVVDGAFVTKTTYKPPVNETPEKKTTKSPPEDKKPVTAGAFVTKTTNKPPVNETPEKTTTKSPPEDKKPVTAAWWWSLVYVSVGGAALVAITLGVVAWRRTKGNKTKTDDDADDPEGGVAYASVSFTKNTAGRAQAGLHPDDEEEGGAVTYTTLKPPRPSAAADPAALYATVTKPAR